MTETELIKYLDEIEEQFINGDKNPSSFDLGYITALRYVLNEPLTR